MALDTQHNSPVVLPHADKDERAFLEGLFARLMREPAHIRGKYGCIQAIVQR